MGCFAIGCSGLLAVILVAILIPVIVNAVNNSHSRDAVATTGDNDIVPDGAVGDATDPIEQAQVVLGDAYSYATIKAVTDAALSATGTAISDENYSRAWSAVLNVTKNLTDVSPMGVMECVVDLGPSSRMSFPETAALCATTIHLDD
jgi:hypothetical protein